MLRENVKFMHCYKEENILEKRDENGNTPLHIAAQCSNEVLLLVLLDLGANVNVLNKEGRTPLYYAYKNKRLWALLIFFGACRYKGNKCKKCKGCPKCVCK